MKRNALSSRTIFAIAMAALVFASSARAQMPNAAPSASPVQFQLAGAAPKAAIAADGTFVVDIVVAVSSGLANGAEIDASVYISTTDNTGSASISGTAAVKSGKASLTLTVPYSWLVGSTADKVSFQVQVSGSGYSKNGEFDLYYTDTTTRSIALPKNGATTKVAFRRSL